jgi:hypothetical protein
VGEFVGLFVLTITDAVGGDDGFGVGDGVGDLVGVKLAVVVDIAFFPSSASEVVVEVVDVDVVDPDVVELLVDVAGSISVVVVGFVVVEVVL